MVSNGDGKIKHRRIIKEKDEGEIKQKKLRKEGGRRTKEE